MADIISERLVLVGKTTRWRRSGAYQESNAKGPGWLELRSEDGRICSHSEVVDIDGFDGPQGKYLVVEEGTYP